MVQLIIGATIGIYGLGSKLSENRVRHVFLISVVLDKESTTGAKKVFQFVLNQLRTFEDLDYSLLAKLALQLLPKSEQQLFVF